MRRQETLIVLHAEQLLGVHAHVQKQINHLKG